MKERKKNRLRKYDKFGNWETRLTKRYEKNDE